MSVDWLTVIATSAVSNSITAALLKYFGDRRIEREKAQQSRDLQEAQNAFDAGVTSHMARVAFEKLVEFCEEYALEVLNALQTLSGEEGLAEALDTGKFSQIRQKWALWLTPQIDSKLDSFEVRIAGIIGGAAPDRDANDLMASNEKIIRQQISFLRDVLRTEALAAWRAVVLNQGTRYRGNPAA